MQGSSQKEIIGITIGALMYVKEEDYHSVFAHPFNG
jgi:hypothetical protein